MNRKESYIIGSILAVMIPILLVACCWFCIITAMMLGVWIFPDSIAIALLVVSFLTGLAIDVCCLRKWTQSIYRANMKLMIILYLVCSFIAIGMFMGVPIGNLALGILAGLYIGRRCFHMEQGKDSLNRFAHNTSFFTAFIMGLVSFPVGMLALFAGEEYVIISVVESLRIGYSRIAGIGFILALCGLLMLLQYWLARGASILAYRGWTKYQE